MALSFAFLIDTTASVHDVSATVSQVASAARLVGRSSDSFEGNGSTLESGVLVQVGPKTPSPFNPVQDNFGFTPNVLITFRLSNVEDSARQQDDMVRIVAGAFDRIDGDAILHFQYDLVWLLRRHGQITICDRDTIWTQRRIEILGRPHERGNPAFTDE
jgi:hypothetical protein